MHHGSPKGWSSQGVEDQYLTMLDEGFRRDSMTIIDHMLQIYALNGAPFEGMLEMMNISQFTVVAAGIINLCDWIASGEFDYVSDAKPLSEYKVSSEARAKELFIDDRLNMLKKKTPEPVFEDVFGFSPSPIQHAMHDLDTRTPGMMIVEDATGSGKTEASLIYALRCLSDTSIDGITFALPTRATSNLMFSRLNGYAGSMVSDEASVSLQHGSSRLFLETEGLNPERTWVGGRNKALFANISVCTVDQVLSAVIAARYQPLRLLSIIRHVVVIDEVHAYDAYMFNLLCTLVKYCRTYSIPLILLSATIPSSMRIKLLEAYGAGAVDLDMRYPMLTACSASGVRQIPCTCSDRSRRLVKLRYVSDNSIIVRELVDLASEGMRVCWIRNTVDDAISAFNKIPSGSYEIILLHSRFIQQDRSDIEKKLFSMCEKGATKTGLIVVSTQVIEQSLDIEFERVYSDLAPVDALIQRMGRDQRFGDSDIPCEFVVNGPSLNDSVTSRWYSDYLHGASFVYQDHSVLYNTALLMKRDIISIPEDYREFIESAYKEPDEDSPFIGNHREFLKSHSSSEANSQRVILNPEDGYGLSLSEEFSDNTWDALERAATREVDDRTAQCLLLEERDGIFRPISGSVDTSVITIKKKLVPSPDESEEYSYGKWRYIGKLRMTRTENEEGNTIWASKGLRYSKIRGAEYV